MGRLGTFQVLKEEVLDAFLTAALLQVQHHHTDKTMLGCLPVSPSCKGAFWKFRTTWLPARAHPAASWMCSTGFVLRTPAMA